MKATLHMLDHNIELVHTNTRVNISLLRMVVVVVLTVILILRRLRETRRLKLL